MRSSFEEAIGILEDAGIDVGELGIQIGVEYGPTAITRLGVHGERVRCCISRGVLRSEAEQCRCKGNETAIGPVVHGKAPKALRTLFDDNRIRADFDYDEATDALDGILCLRDWTRHDRIGSVWVLARRIETTRRLALW